MNFNEQCYKLLSSVPSGRVTTYKFLAEALGTKAYRAVGNAMNKNPYPRDIVPCHRVVNTDGRIGGYAGNIDEKINRLAQENVIVAEGKIKNFKHILHTFK